MKVRWHGEPASSTCMRDLHYLCKGKRSENIPRFGNLKPWLKCECPCHQTQNPGVDPGPVPVINSRG